MNNYIKKLTSRKFLVSAAGIASGIALIISGNETEGVTAVIASVLGYLVAEGYIDAKAVKVTAEAVSDTVEAVEEDTEDNDLEYSIGTTD